MVILFLLWPSPAKDDVLWIPHKATCDTPRLMWIHGGSGWAKTLGRSVFGVQLRKVCECQMMCVAATFTHNYQRISKGCMWNARSAEQSTQRRLRWFLGLGAQDEFVG